MTSAMGVDVGGSGIKGAVVDLATGELLTDRLKIPTPSPSTPRAVAAAVADLVTRADWQGPLGCTVPGVVQAGVVRTAANIAPEWVGADGVGLLSQATGRAVALLNDADAAGIAEMRFGVGRGRGGVVILLTFGTGIGSAVFVDGRLVPNTELGHLQMWGGSAERRASAGAKTGRSLSWKKWTRRVDAYLRYVENLLWPDLLVVGGGVSRDHARWLPLLHTRAPIVPAELRNNAGIVGAAVVAADAAAQPEG
ncbi:MAG: ROK family protein [Actinobacteria bacterium]|nr:ROK family protein [Actinomycetota bacterium]